MKNKISFIFEHGNEGLPVVSRMLAFKDYFNKNDYSVEFINKPKNFLTTINTILKIKKDKKDLIFISMPSFRGFLYFFIPGVKVILDIRDGWSIAQATGYGGTTERKPFKAKITKIIEKIIIRRSKIAITCTLGLKLHLENLSKRKITLIPNGILDDDHKLSSLINEEKNKNKETKNKSLTFTCAGKFSEYGKEKVKKLLNVIINRYPQQTITIQLIGSSLEENEWISKYLYTISMNRAKVIFLPRMDRKNLYKTISNSDFGLTIIRDPEYDVGTKIYDYIALDIPVINYFDEPNNFTSYFDSCLDLSFENSTEKPEILRSKLISQALDQEILKL
ncbi:hypothetical protein ACLPHM_13360 [Paenalcaligenes sp. Me131]|uniref:hypothetical protein n=1 Tax=Paenalcaligenes sp. Me131 TaxID=3392636 RepID=UPI003D2DE8E6